MLNQHSLANALRMPAVFRKRMLILFLFGGVIRRVARDEHKLFAFLAAGTPKNTAAICSAVFSMSI